MFDVSEACRTSFLSLSHLTTAEVAEVGETAYRFGNSPKEFADRLQGARVGLLFTAPSTRTRSSFWNAAVTLGCHTLHLGSSELQVSTGESWGDTGAVLAHYVDAAVVRTNGPQDELRQLAEPLPATVNALTYEEHPTQAVADLCALRDHFGSAENLRLAYLGLVNNTARSLAQLACKVPGMRLDVYSPEGAGFPDEEVAEMNGTAGRDVVSQRHSVPDAPHPVDGLYTTRWQSMGVAHEDPDWQSRFAPFRVTRSTMERFSGETEAVFLHDLPAIRDQEATSEVLDAPLSLVPRQAYHKTSAAAAALLRVLGEGATGR
ncbi:ornithine carbamoyltransferase [Streptomyces sp. Rer75]|uniref:ornithine carbamoyltransferase n=1 Tax=unclassified Streptomyces TaxID=2593676 RepID=UPI0015CF8EFA|nr:ornithine carbamoyltransferase [Streptomyces sp. Rer75]QLH25616.1 ornithine carbamoyltransferase [Streptomyces sp. Rer75]